MSRTDLAVSFAADLAADLAPRLAAGTATDDDIALYRDAVRAAHRAVVLANGDSEAPILRRTILDRHAF